jgi:hypothetical protein
LDVVEMFLAKLETPAVRNSAIRVLESAAEKGSAEVAKRLFPSLGPGADLTLVLEAATLSTAPLISIWSSTMPSNMESQLHFLWFLDKSS